MAARILYALGLAASLSGCSTELDQVDTAAPLPDDVLVTLATLEPEDAGYPAPVSATATTSSDVIACSCDVPVLLGTCTSYLMSEPSSHARRLCDELHDICPGSFAPAECLENDLGTCLVVEKPGKLVGSLSYHSSIYTPATAEANCDAWGGSYRP